MGYLALSRSALLLALVCLGCVGALTTTSHRTEAEDNQQAVDKFQAIIYRKAAEAGDASAQYSLGELYRLGRGAPRDMTQASLWYEKAAAGGHASAQWMLGIMRMAKKVGIDPFDPQRVFSTQDALNASAKEMRRLLDKYDNNYAHALAAWDWGEAEVDAWVAEGADFKRLPRETQEYVSGIMGGPQQDTPTSKVAEATPRINTGSDVLDNVLIEMFECVSYYAILSETLTMGNVQDGASRADAASKQVLMNAMVLMMKKPLEPAILDALIAETKNDLTRRISGNVNNIEVLGNQYNDLCRMLLKSPEDRLRYWVDRLSRQ